MNARIKIILLTSVAAITISLWPHHSLFAQNSKQRILVLTDIANEPDDQQSLVRLLVYANEFDVEGLVATTSCWLKKGPREDLIRQSLGAYGQVLTNLAKHAVGYPPAGLLQKVTCTGQTSYGLTATGEGKSTAGSKLIIGAAIKEDARPLWISIWGGANTLAQALTDARKDLSAAAFSLMISRLRVYSISDQDDAGPWIRKEFPALFYIVNPSNADYQSYHAATWSGISGDRHYRTGVYYHFDMVDNPWLEKNIILNHGPLGALYPKLAYIMEGDTPSFLGLINNGLGWAESPDYGGWGGRYQLYQPYGETRAIWTSNQTSMDSVDYDAGKYYISDGATIWRWREQFQNDFAARMNWCVADVYSKANHNPIAVLNGDSTKMVLKIIANNAATISLSANGTFDPDGNKITMKWWIYQDAGGVPGATLGNDLGTSTVVNLSQVKKKGQIHIIFEAKDNGTPALVAYRRVIITVN